MRLILLLSALLAGCSYPEIGFLVDAEPDAEPAADAPREESTAACACTESERCVENVCRPYTSCASLHEASPSLGSAVYTLDPDGAGPIAPFAAYCEMKDDGGGWTLALKADGTKKTFVYDAPLWTNADTLNPDAPDLDTTEAKLASFSTMPFSALRLGMLDGTRHFIRLDVGGPSLRAKFAGPQVVTNFGRTAWLGLLADPRLQPYCNAEGFNRDFTKLSSIAARARLGFLGNNEPDCISPDSWIGFGAGFVAPHMCVGEDPGVVVGNYNPLSCGGSAGNERATAVFGYVFLR